MTYKDVLAHGFSNIVDKAGKIIRVRYYTMTIGSVWDDDTTLTEVTGSEVWTSGIVLPLDNRPSSADSLLVEQGKLTNQDQRLYVHGSLVLTGSEFKTKIQLGSSTTAETYSIIEPGAITYEAQGQQIYKKVYIRRLTTGSLMGEA